MPDCTPLIAAVSHACQAALGMVLCLGIMFSTFVIFAIASIVCCAILYKYIQHQKVTKQWGDGVRGMRYQTARQALLSLEKMTETHTKNWRPQVLVFGRVSDEGELRQPSLLEFLAQLKGARGISIISTALAGDLMHDAAKQMRIEKKLRQTRDAHHLRGFTQVVMSSDIETALDSLLQTAGLGGLGPNTVVTLWPTSWRQSLVGARRMKQILASAHAINMALILIKGIEEWPDSHAVVHSTIDIWWVVHDGGLLLLLATILHRHRTWRHTTLRVFVVCQHGDDPAELERAIKTFLYDMRIHAALEVVQLEQGLHLKHILPARGATWKHGEATIVPRYNKAIVAKPIGAQTIPQQASSRYSLWEGDGRPPTPPRSLTRNSTGPLPTPPRSLMRNSTGPLSVGGGGVAPTPPRSLLRSRSGPITSVPTGTPTPPRSPLR